MLWYQKIPSLIVSFERHPVRLLGMMEKSSWNYLNGWYGIRQMTLNYYMLVINPGSKSYCEKHQRILDDSQTEDNESQKEEKRKGKHNPSLQSQLQHEDDYDQNKVFLYNNSVKL